MILSSIITLASFAHLGSSLCPPPGPLLSPPSLEPKTSNFTIPETVLNSFTFRQNTSFAIKASIGDTIVFEHEHSAPGREVAQSLYDTQIRIASATKLITALAIVLSEDTISLEDPITKWVPGLSTEFYGEVNIASLADHTSGLGRFGYVGDYAISGVNVSALGLPKVNNTLPGCDPAPGGRVCSNAEVLAMFNNPTYAPHSPESGSMYSNIAYILLGKALEKAHNKTYEAVIQDLILDPVGMSKSTFVPPTNNQTAILPRFPWDASWFVPAFGNLNAVGGLWSTPNDMLKLLQALQNHDLLSKAKLRKWMQPTTFLRSLQQANGIAWEILRPNDLKLAFPRPLDIYTKAGGVPGYASYAVLIPEYNIALTINAAGGGDQLYVAAIELLATVSSYLIPYADQLARTQAASKYAGTYSLSGSASSNTVTLSANNGPGLEVVNMTINNVPVLSVLAARAKAPLKNFSVRLYPTDPDSLGTAAENWRLLPDSINTTKVFADLGCATWNAGDWGRYQGGPLDTVTFGMKDGKAESVELQGWRVKLTRVA
ncbi:hypothetical protein ACN47E_002263 [Coniothyrium glycines]